MNYKKTALFLGDLQNNFLHPEGSYAKAGLSRAWMSSLPEKIAPLVAAARANKILVVASLFTLPPGRDGEPIITDDLRRLRPFLAKGDFQPGSWNHQLVEALAPADMYIEKVAYSAFHATRLDWILRKSGIENLLFTGIVTNVGISTTVRDAHVLEYDCTLIEDGCAAFNEADHQIAVQAIRAVARVTTIADTIREISAV